MELSRKQRLEEIMMRMSELNRYFATTRDDFLAKFELSRPQAELLFAIRHQRMSIGALAKQFVITPSAVSQMVSQLELKRLAVRRSDPDDRRVTYVELSRDTKDYFARMRRLFVNHLNERFMSISERELASLQSILSKITNELKEE